MARKKAESRLIPLQIIEFTYDKYVERPMTEEELKHRRGRRPKSGVVTVKERVQGTYRCRRIVRRTDDGKDTVEFITNVLDPEEMSAEQVCETYRRRWSIESLFYDKFIVMRSHSKFISDYQYVTILLLISALHNNMVVMPSFYLNVRTNGYQKAYF